LEPALEYSSDRTRLDVDLIHSVLTRAYWSVGIPRATVERAIAGSTCFGLYRGGQQLGFARLISDQATFAYLADVFVVEAERGKGLGKALVGHVLEVASGWGLRRLLLATADAHALYRSFGFSALGRPESFMEVHRKDAYVGATVVAPAVPDSAG
jgi:GNAT superfamily N-acetyltransferase